MKKLTLILASFCMLFSLNMMAQQRGGGNFNFEERMKQQIESLKKELALNDKQVQEVTDLLKESGKKTQEVMKNSQGNREQMREKMTKMREEENASMKKILTEEQFKKYTDYQKKQQEEREKRMKERGAGGNRTR